MKTLRALPKPDYVINRYRAPIHRRVNWGVAAPWFVWGAATGLGAALALAYAGVL